LAIDPTSHISDVALLIENGYGLKKLTMVDMFPHTPHIETVGILEKN